MEGAEATTSAADEAQESSAAEDTGTLLRAFRSGDVEAGYSCARFGQAMSRRATTSLVEAPRRAVEGGRLRSRVARAGGLSRARHRQHAGTVSRGRSRDIADAVLDREIAQLIHRVELDLARILAAGLRQAPAHIRLGEIPRTVASFSSTQRPEGATGFASALMDQLAQLGSAREILALLAGLERTPLAADDENAFDSAAALGGRRTPRPPGARVSARGVRLRNAVWRLLPRLDEARRRKVLDVLLGARLHRRQTAPVESAPTRVKLPRLQTRGYGA